FYLGNKSTYLHKIFYTLLSIGILIIILNYYSSLLDSIQILIEFGKEYLSAEASYDRLKKSVKDSFLRKKITKKV
uniref:hypothetical protein n=1 Tax=Dubosiella newyorkensis TaxID=1862672 RepID=UPI0023F0CDC7